MDRERTLLITVCLGLAKAHAQLQDTVIAARWHSERGAMTIRDLLGPVSPWIAGLAPNQAISGVVARLLRVQAHLLALVEAPEPVDMMSACVILQHIHGDIGFSGWWKPARWLASELGVDLPGGPAHITHGTSLIDAGMPRRGKPPFCSEAEHRASIDPTLLTGLVSVSGARASTRHHGRQCVLRECKPAQE
jgi:hypothetical protein